MNKQLVRRVLLCALMAAALTAFSRSGLLFTADSALSDRLYQRPQALDDRIVLVGIDQRSLEALGRFQDWDRDVLAQALEVLSADPENRPAVIGVDMLFTGETNPVHDARLARAAAVCGNVVTAASAQFGSDLVVGEGGFYMDDFAVLGYEAPYPALGDVTARGHINAMLDGDGVLRHALFRLTLPDGTAVSSFHREIYRLYAEYAGLDPDVAPPLNRDGFWYVPFGALPGGYDEGISLSDLIAGAVPADAFADKIVLIGPYAPALQDAYVTAVDRATPMYGMEYQANCIDALIRGNFKTEVPPPVQAAALFLLCLFCALWFWDRRVLPATAVWLGLSAGWIGLGLLAWELGYVLGVFYPPLSVTALYVAAVALNYIRAAREKGRIAGTFRRYVAPEIVTELLKEGPEALALGGKLTEITVLFVDIRGFTTLSESLEPPQVVEILNRCLTLISGCILRSGGTLDKFIGDCAMAFWGAPLPQDDGAFKAVRAALDMVAEGEVLSKELETQYGRVLSFGVGIHSGPAVVGNIGSPLRMDYTAIGDTVNTAARLESVAAGGQILVSRGVADALAGRVAFTSLGREIPLKGKAAGFEILCVDGLASPS